MIARQEGGLSSDGLLCGSKGKEFILEVGGLLTLNSGRQVSTMTQGKLLQDPKYKRKKTDLLTGSECM